MSIDVLMPKLGESITEGTILEWKKKVGEKIAKDETLLEISTDKVDSEIPSPDSGNIIEILYEVNDVVPVGEVIARIGSGNEKIIKEENNIKIDNDEEISDNDFNINESKSVDNDILISTHEDIELSKRFYSPLVKSIAKKENISMSDLESIKGSGVNNRVSKKDILKFLKTKNTSSSDNINVLSSTAENKTLSDNLEPMGHVRLMIADHMKKSNMPNRL